MREIEQDVRSGPRGMDEGEREMGDVVRSTLLVHS